MTKYWIGPVIGLHLFATIIVLISASALVRMAFHQYLIHLAPLALLRSFDPTFVTSLLASYIHAQNFIDPCYCSGLRDLARLYVSLVYGTDPAAVSFPPDAEKLDRTSKPGLAASAGNRYLLTYLGRAVHRDRQRSPAFSTADVRRGPGFLTVIAVHEVAAIRSNWHNKESSHPRQILDEEGIEIIENRAGFAKKWHPVVAVDRYRDSKNGLEIDNMKHLIFCREYPPAPGGGIGTYAFLISHLLAEFGETVHVISQYGREQKKRSRKNVMGA